MKLPFTEYVAAVRREGSSLIAAASQDLSLDVPSCPGWTVADLVEHVSRIYLRIANRLELRSTAADLDLPPLPEGEPAVVLGELLDELVVQLTAAGADAPVWNWSDGSAGRSVFWGRRMAHETLIHRFDAQRAGEVAEPLDGDLAADGLDELIDVLTPRVLSRDSVTLPAGALVLASLTHGDWRLGLGDDGVTRLEVSPANATVVRGTASALLLAAAGRVPWAALDVSGDDGVLRAWSTITF